jgi:hypothetical protein
LLSFSGLSSLHRSVPNGHLEVARLLVESKADVAAINLCFSPPPSHHPSLTICLAAMAALHSDIDKYAIENDHADEFRRCCIPAQQRRA